jgi:hypothetical protein
MKPPASHVRKAFWRARPYFPYPKIEPDAASAREDNVLWDNGRMNSLHRKKDWAEYDRSKYPTKLGQQR